MSNDSQGVSIVEDYTYGLTSIDKLPILFCSLFIHEQPVSNST